MNITDDRETAWADINPPMVSAPRAVLPSASSARLQPATSDRFRDELEACLALVVPVGMDEAARREWLAIAWETLKHLPADLLAAGCRKAREVSDHPSKIVPIIIAETSEALERRRRSAQPANLELPAPVRRDLMQFRGQPMSEADTEELNRILTDLNATARYRPDGSRYTVAQATGGR